MLTSRFLLISPLFACAMFAFAMPGASSQLIPDPGCTAIQAWQWQANPRTDPSGKNNIELPLTLATYWGTPLAAAIGSTVTIHGQFPATRYMSLELYDTNGNVLDDIADYAIDPDPGQNNPFRSGGSSVQGTYTAAIVFGRKPFQPAPNTIYTGSTTSIVLIYRVYYPNTPDDLSGGTTAPVLPTLFTEGGTLPTCPPRPIITPQTATVWGRLDQIDFVGVKPAQVFPAFYPPRWNLTATNSSTNAFPNQDNSYMTAVLSRTYLAAPFNNDLVVMRMRAPTFTDTQSGVPPYASADMRFWGVCTNEPLSTGVVRCLGDDQSPNVGGFVTYVISDPSKMPPPNILSPWGASWLAWGALEPGDSVYDANGDLLTNADGVFYYGLVLYRQTLASSSFTQSITNIAKLPGPLQQPAMGDYWPEIGYCTLADFEASGAGCVGRR